MSGALWGKQIEASANAARALRFRSANMQWGACAGFFSPFSYDTSPKSFPVLQAVYFPLHTRD